MKRRILLGVVAALILLTAGIIVGLRLGGGRKNETPARDADGSQDVLSAASDSDLGCEKAIKEFFQAIEQMDAEKYLSFMMLDFPGMGAISSHDKLEMQRQLELGILDVEYTVRNVAPGSLSDFVYEEFAGWLAPQIEEIVMMEVDVRVRCKTESLSGIFVLWLIKTNEGRWYIVDDSGSDTILTR